MKLKAKPQLPERVREQCIYREILKIILDRTEAEMLY